VHRKGSEEKFCVHPSYYNFSTAVVQANFDRGENELDVPQMPRISVLTISAPMIYTAPCIMFWKRAYPLLGEVGGGWALEFSSFLGPVKWHPAVR
jgi:hypothetical protein